MRQGIWGSKWVGMKHFENFWGTYSFKRLITNTLTLSVYSLVAGFPIPILLALMLNECGNLKYKKAVQMITYAPHFISTVVMCSIILLVVTSANNGILNNMLAALGATERVDFITKPNSIRISIVVGRVAEHGLWFDNLHCGSGGHRSFAA